MPNMDRLAEDWYRKWDPEFDDDEDEDEEENEDEDEDEDEDEELGDCDEYDIAQDSKLMEEDHAN